MIPSDRLPIVVTTKYYRCDPEGITIFLEERDVNRVRRWRQLNEELYVVIMPAKELERQQVIIKARAR